MLEKLGLTKYYEANNLNTFKRKDLKEMKAIVWLWEFDKALIVAFLKL